MPLTALAGLVIVTLGPGTPALPWRQPQLAASGSLVGLAFGSGKAIYFSASRDQGRSFAEPVKVAESGALALGRHRGPRVAFAGDAILISAVVGKVASAGPHAHGSPADGDLVLWRSTDGGRSWSGGQAVNDVPGAAREGLHAMAADGRGNVFIAWLDLRAKGTQLFGARSRDGGLTWSKNVRIYQSPEATICECCHPSAALDERGRILVMWRNNLAGSRDMYLARSEDGSVFSAPEKLGTGTWELKACPMDGGGIALAQSHVVTAWRRNTELFVASPGEPEKRIGEGKDIAVASGGQGVFAVWSGTAGNLLARTPQQQEPFILSTHGSFPSVTGLPNGTAIAAWEQDGRILVEPLQ